MNYGKPIYQPSVKFNYDPVSQTKNSKNDRNKNRQANQSNYKIGVVNINVQCLSGFKNPMSSIMGIRIQKTIWGVLVILVISLL